MNHFLFVKLNGQMRTKKLKPLFYIMCLTLSALYLCYSSSLYGEGGWTPHTGVFDFSIVHEDIAEEAVEHAIALIAFGQTRQGIRQLRRLVRKHPEADWVGTANYYMGIGSFQLGRYERAFNFLDTFILSQPETPDIAIARKLQLESAKRLGEDSINTAKPLFDKLIAEASGADFLAAVRWTLAELYFELRRYHDAMGAYMDFVDFHPFHPDAGEAWFKIAESSYRVALGIERAQQYLDEAEAALEDFLSHFETHERVEDAQVMLEDIRSRQAKRSFMVVDYYLEIKENPYAAMYYLRRIMDRFEAEIAENAHKRYNQIKSELESPPPGEFLPMTIQGIIVRE